MLLCLPLEGGAWVQATTPDSFTLVIHGLKKIRFLVTHLYNFRFKHQEGPHSSLQGSIILNQKSKIKNQKSEIREENSKLITYKEKEG